MKIGIMVHLHALHQASVGELIKEIDSSLTS